MTHEVKKLLKQISKALIEYEDSINNSAPVGCYVDLGINKDIYEFDGEKLQKTSGIKITKE